MCGARTYIAERSGECDETQACEGNLTPHMTFNLHYVLIGKAHNAQTAVCGSYAYMIYFKTCSIDHIFVNLHAHLFMQKTHIHKCTDVHV